MYWQYRSDSAVAEFPMSTYYAIPSDVLPSLRHHASPFLAFDFKDGRGNTFVHSLTGVCLSNAVNRTTIVFTEIVKFDFLQNTYPFLRSNEVANPTTPIHIY